MKKMNLKNLKVQSFVTSLEKGNEQTVKGGGTTDLGIFTVNCTPRCEHTIADVGCGLRTALQQEC
ncbi:hypothetical protein C900_02602 [Fulvivirga imtechensis AK7]|uniref:Uncharacterized protein n=1 Tax=Fulvivirga imtechensis AK7 TaxID=1237149 RepID=L8JVB0_9BACT|nr:pinensin family lanthipeptide [Fulvivirga imtechensis]ELR71539.1 hypothetical protein C900_02602 [Fulvivirga imtechensis AK7]